MRTITWLFFICTLAGIVAGCQNKPCRDIQNQKDSEAASSVAAPPNGKGPQTSTPGAGVLKVRVYKPDGSLQCGMGKKIALDVMEKELKGITIFSRSNRNDGLMRIQVCGAPTGNANVYEINRDDLEKALKLGFKEWTFE